MTEQETIAAGKGTLRPLVGRFGHCMDCANWKPQGAREWSKRGACDQHERAMTSYDSGCNGKFVPANIAICVKTDKSK